MATKRKKAPAAEVTQSLVRSVFLYEAETGIFLRRSSGLPATSKHSAGYLTVRVGRRNLLAHRVAWLYERGSFPVNQLDHINGDRSDNRIDNLRECTNAQNSQNVKPHRDGSGFLGASLDKRWNRWQAGIGINGKRVHLGYFSTAQEAHEAYLRAKQNLHAFGGARG